MSYKYIDAAALKGQTIKEIKQTDKDRIEIEFSDGKKYLMWHSQDCCEDVDIHDIQGGGLESLVGSPLIIAYEEIMSGSDGGQTDWPQDVEKDGHGASESYTWTIYHFSTETANIIIRWLGTSNGYYSESVSLDETT